MPNLEFRGGFFSTDGKSLEMPPKYAVKMFFDDKECIVINYQRGKDQTER